MKMKDGTTNVIRSIPISADEQQISAAREAAIRIHILLGTEGDTGRTYISPSMDEVSCRVPCDYVPRRSWPLFKARAVLRGLLASNDLEGTS